MLRSETECFRAPFRLVMLYFLMAAKYMSDIPLVAFRFCLFGQVRDDGIERLRLFLALQKINGESDLRLQPIPYAGILRLRVDFVGYTISLRQ